MISQSENGTRCDEVTMPLPVHLHESIFPMKCYLCSNILSVGPLMMVSYCDVLVKCGRCKNLRLPSMKRHLSTEAFMKMHLLPCIYPDCDKKLIWDEVESHEKTCDKKIITCPMLNCRAPVRQQVFEEHLKHLHETRCYVGTAELLTIDGLSSLSFITYDRQCFIVMMRQNEHIAEIGVVSVNDVADNYLYDFKLSDGVNPNNKCSFLVEGMPVRRYDDREYCFKCFNHKCDLLYHPYSNISDDNPGIDSINTEAILRSIRQFRYFIKIRTKIDCKLTDDEDKDDCDVDSCKEVDQTDFEHSSDVLREQLQCPICLRYMLRNIYQCEVGHVICDLCKKEVTQCPVCRGQLRDLRNLPLEKLVDEATIACPNYTRGCDVTDTVKRLSIHELHCSFR